MVQPTLRYADDVHPYGRKEETILMKAEKVLKKLV